MEKRIIKAIIAERQKEISEIQLVERPISFEESGNYVLVGIRRAGPDPSEEKNLIALKDKMKSDSRKHL